MQITYLELFQFCLVIIGIVGLFLQAKRSNRPGFQPGGYFKTSLRGKPFTGSAFF